jgi:polyisoprenoid-binding protein YceI
MKKYILILAVGFFQSLNAQDLYKATTGEISFFSETPIENIDATNKLVKALINTKDNQVAFFTTIIGFHFKKPLMEEHFNENYMESDKFPTAKFQGKIAEEIDYTKDGEYTVTAKGTLTLHGVEKKREIAGKLIVKNGKLELIVEFEVKLADHNIDIPKIVMEKIAETVTIKMNVNFEKK